MVIPVGVPVAFVRTIAEGVPRAGVTSVGEVLRTTPPVPVGTAARAVAMPVPSPTTPVEIGKPVPLVRTTAEGVPSAGVVSTGETAKTLEPVPVLSVSGPWSDPVVEQSSIDKKQVKK